MSGNNYVYGVMEAPWWERCQYALVNELAGYCAIIPGDDGTVEIFGDPDHHGPGGFRLTIPEENLWNAEPPDRGDGTWIVLDIDGEAYAIKPLMLVRYDHVREIGRLSGVLGYLDSGNRDAPGR